MSSLREFRNLDIDWSMTQADAVTMYLEWGNNGWKGERQPVRSKSDESVYFVVYTWDARPKVLLIRRNSEEARELTSLELPHEMGERFLDSVGRIKGVYQPSDEVRQWLERQLNN